MSVSATLDHSDLYLNSYASHVDLYPATRLIDQIDNPFFSEALFDLIPDVVFFVKDLAGRYSVVNQTLVKRCQQPSKTALIGKKAADMFAAPVADGFDEQDRYVLTSGKELQNQLELRLYPNGESIWCVTHKLPLRDAAHRVIGLAGISRDLGMPNQRHPIYHGIAAAVRHLHSYYFQDLQMDILAQLTNLSMAEIETSFHQIFSLTPRQMLTKLRIEAAINLFDNADTSWPEVAQKIGYQDVTIFASIFKTTLGLTPGEYRESSFGTSARRRHL